MVGENKKILDLSFFIVILFPPDINQAFLAACRSIMQDDEKVTGKVKVIISPSSQGQIGWKCLSLQYSVPWPLHLILGDKSLVNYNQVFQFLLTVKRTQLNLHDVWASQLSNKAYARYLQNSPALRAQFLKIFLHF